MKLTKRTVDALPVPRAGKRFYWDDALPGFGMSVTSGGVKSYVLDYRHKGRQRRITIGRHGEEMPPDEARKEAGDFKAAIRKGIDPLAERERGRREPTFEDLAREYERVHLPRKRSGKEDLRFIAYAKARLGRRKLSSLTRREIQALHRRKGETAPVQANRMIACLSKMF
ncbi:MAG: Arm DNA-binding domain-containing protein, partial [bacterium]|nr:Arm DNA-binding domain-containing protein [bacterium]